MPRRLITISYTALDAGGGVPKFNRDLHAAFPDRECKHFCWEDFPWATSPDLVGLPEWERARALNSFLVKTRAVTAADVVVADGFWAAGLEHLPLVISHSHGIWSHLTHEDVLASKLPDMPFHHAAQVTFRKRWRGQLRKRMTAVSEFIAKQLELQWGLDVDQVINNGVDITEQSELPIANRTGYAPLRANERPPELEGKTVLLHGINDPGNKNKGWDHIEALHEAGLETICFDQLCDLLVSGRSAFPNRHSARLCALSSATLVVHPSGYEGNSMFVAEALACGVPVVGYDVGFLYTLRDGPLCSVMKREERSPQHTLETVRRMLSDRDCLERAGRIARIIATQHLNIERFKSSWRSYIGEVEGGA